jgi:hypothetical protein
LAGGLNPYLYANGNPLRYADPYGLFSASDVTDAVFGAVWYATDGWSPSQGLVNGVAGFGDGAYAAITLGIGDLQDVRDVLGVDGGIDACSTTYQLSSLAGNVVGAGALAGAGAVKAFQYTGPAANWLRLGRSYSQTLQGTVRLSLRWGASPAKNGKYLQQIPSQTLRALNQWMRNQRVPLPGWRYADPGHLHLWR